MNKEELQVLCHFFLLLKKKQLPHLKMNNKLFAGVIPFFLLLKKRKPTFHTLNEKQTLPFFPLLKKNNLPPVKMNKETVQDQSSNTLLKIIKEINNLWEYDMSNLVGIIRSYVHYTFYFCTNAMK